MSVYGVIQARMASARLPGKVMMPLAGIPLFLHIHDRLSRVKGIDGVILATTTDPANDDMVALARDNGMTVVRWSDEDDIVGRLCRACEVTGADALLKVNADCPLVDPDIMQALLDRFLAVGTADFASNKIEPTYPLGYSIELVSARALNWCNQNLAGAEERELVIKWIMDRPGQFEAISLKGAADYSALDLTVDTAADFEEVSEIFNRLYVPGEAFGLAAVAEMLASETELICCP